MTKIYTTMAFQVSRMMIRTCRKLTNILLKVPVMLPLRSGSVSDSNIILLTNNMYNFKQVRIRVTSANRHLQHFIQLNPEYHMERRSRPWVGVWKILAHKVSIWVKTIVSRVRLMFRNTRLKQSVHPGLIYNIIIPWSGLFDMLEIYIYYWNLLFLNNVIVI